jgi:hypothetical protein
MTSLGMRLSAIIAVFLFVAAYGMEAGSPKPTPVEVWSGGDDGLTQSLKVAIENAFKSSPDFSVSYGKKPGTLIVTIPTHVQWKHVGRRTKVIYTVEFASVEEYKLGSQKGSCWDDTLAKCAAQIVKDAKVAARRIP